MFNKLVKAKAMEEIEHLKHKHTHYVDHKALQYLNLPQLRRAPIVKVLYKQANIGFAAEAVFLGGGKGGISPKKGCNAPSAG
jgi:hypothetical protein